MALILHHKFQTVFLNYIKHNLKVDLPKTGNIT